MCTTLICRSDITRFDVHQVTIDGITATPTEQVQRDASTGFYPCATCKMMGHRTCFCCSAYICDKHLTAHPRKFLKVLCPACLEKEQESIRSAVFARAEVFAESQGYTYVEQGSHYLDANGKQASIGDFELRRRQWVARQLEDQEITFNMVRQYI